MTFVDKFQKYPQLRVKENFKRVRSSQTEAESKVEVRKDKGIEVRLGRHHNKLIATKESEGTQTESFKKDKKRFFYIILLFLMIIVNVYLTILSMDLFPAMDVNENIKPSIFTNAFNHVLNTLHGFHGIMTG